MSIRSTWQVTQIVSQQFANESVTLEQTSNVWLVASADEGFLIDSGYGQPEQHESIIHSIRLQELHICGIILTHGHRDHSLGAVALSQILNCPIYCHPLEHPLLTRTWQQSSISSVSSVVDLRPTLIHNTYITFGNTTLHVLHTPGHTHGHIALWQAERQVLFAGDTILPSGSVWIGPPDGHMDDYLATLTSLSHLPIVTAYCGHGEPDTSPLTRISHMYGRRLERERQILSLISIRGYTARDLTHTIYLKEIPNDHLEVARRTILAHLDLLEKNGQARAYFDPHLKQRIYTAL